MLSHKDFQKCGKQVHFGILLVSTGLKLKDLYRKDNIFLHEMTVTQPSFVNANLGIDLRIEIHVCVYYENKASHLTILCSTYISVCYFLLILHCGIILPYRRKPLQISLRQSMWKAVKMRLTVWGFEWTWLCKLGIISWHSSQPHPYHCLTTGTEWIWNFDDRRLQFSKLMSACPLYGKQINYKLKPSSSYKLSWVIFLPVQMTLDALPPQVKSIAAGKVIRQQRSFLSSHCHYNAWSKWKCIS